MVTAFKKNGLDVTWMLPPYPKSLDLSKIYAELGVDDPPPPTSRISLHPRFRFKPFLWFNRKALKEADCVYTRVVDVSCCLAQAKIKHSLELHDFGQLQALGIHQALIKWHHEGLIQHFFCISNTIAQAMINEGADASRITITPSGVALDLFSDIPAFDHQRLLTPKMLYFAKVDHEHGRHILESLAESINGKVTAVGASTTEEVNGVSYHKWIPHSEAPKWYGQSDIAIMPYRDDLKHGQWISPIKIFEAWAAGRPILVSDLPPIRELIQHEVNGLLVPPNDPQAWIDAVKYLQSNPDLATRMSKHGLANVEQYSWRNRAKLIADTISA